MNTILIWTVPCIAAYLLGAVPNGLLIARSRGVDIRKVGSGNIGATNVFRGVGKSWGLLTFLLDGLKGFIPAFVFPLIAGRVYEHAPEHLGLACAVIAVLGHNFPIYLNFKGGKGIATTAGALLGVAPAAVGSAFAVWLVVFLLSRYVSLGSILAAIALPVAGWIFYADGNDLVLPIVLSLLGVLGVWRHKSNIQRLANGTESKISFTKKPDDEAAASGPAPEQQSES